MARHICPNRFTGDGARGGCFVEIEPAERAGFVRLRVGWSCVIVHDAEIPLTHLAEIIAIASDRTAGGIQEFLTTHNYGGGYALHVDPA